MDLGMIGLGKMGGNMTRRLVRGGHRVVAYDCLPAAVKTLADERAGVTPAYTLQSLVGHLSPPRTVWMMVPPGEATESVFQELLCLLQQGDALVDGGNANYKDTQRRAGTASERGLHFVDVGTSGGIWGLENGYCLMIGGDSATVDRLTPIFEALAPGTSAGWGHVGPSGAGHFVKMVHNGIEYGLMEAYAEGFDILRAKEELRLDLHQIAEIWRFGSVVRSWLLDVTARALSQDAGLTAVKGWVSDSGMGRWTVLESIDQDTPAPVLALALLMRFVSRQEDSYAARLLAAMRNEFGGHAVRKAERTQEP